MNCNYYNNNVKINLCSKSSKFRNQSKTENETNAIDFYKINDLKINEAIEKALEETKSYDYNKDCLNLQFGFGQSIKNEKKFFQMLD